MGKVGEKIQNIKAKVVKKTYYENNYSYHPTTNTILTVQTPDNKEIVWFTSSNLDDYQTGDEILINAATVKKLGEYNGREQTTVTRAKIMKQENNPPVG